MHYAVVARCRCPDGKIEHYAFQAIASDKKIVKEQAAEYYSTHELCTGGKRVVEVVLDSGSCEEGYENSVKLYDKACRKAERLDRGGQPEEADNVST